jgi:hypothetical protein
MKDTLQNIIQYTAGLGSIDLIKITGTDASTAINAVAEDKSVIISGSLAMVDPRFNGTFGMPNLGKLKTILGFDDYDDTSKISITTTNRNGVDTPEFIHFETSNGDFINDYRLMAKNMIDDKVKDITYHGTGWNVEFEPSVASILRLKKQASANSDETTFVTKIDNGDLKIYFGDPSTHNANFVFQSSVTGKLTKALSWPVQVVIGILNLPGDKMFRINDQGASEITVDSGLAVYKYLIPSHVK